MHMICILVHKSQLATYTYTFTLYQAARPIDIVLPYGLTVYIGLVSILSTDRLKL